MRVFLISLSFAAALCGASFEQREGVIAVKVDGKPFTTFIYSDKWDKPFLHPLISASGEVLTRGWPVEALPGDSNDHTWHRGVWFAHGDVNGVDFWREKGRDQTGRMIPKSAPKYKGDRLSVDLDLVAPDGKRHGTVREVYRFGSKGSTRWIDVEASVIADAGMPMKFGDTEEGTLGLRLREEFRLDRGAVMRNSEGVTGKPIWGKRARWTDYAAKMNGKDVAVAVMDHPKNPRHPTYWHARHYGLNSANPFGVRDFTGDKSADGSLTVGVGETLVFRYRVVVHEGADVEGLYREFAGK